MPYHEVDTFFNKKSMEKGKLALGKSLDGKTLQNLR